MNGADPLAQLRPLHLPEAVGWWPPAPGWWLLTLLLFAACGMLAHTAWRRWRQGSYRRHALRELDGLLGARRGKAADPATVAALNDLLKRVALAHYPREAVARLCGEEWLRFLDSSLASPLFAQGPGQALAELAYRPDGETELHGLGDACRQWIRAQP